MELKIKYQYTYFIKPFVIKKNTYEAFLLNLLNKKDCNLKIFEKEKDLNLYTYFLKDAREFFFPTFSIKKSDFEKLDNDAKVKKISKLHTNIFEYRLKKSIQGKIDKHDGIFFNIDKIQIVCFDSGICFLVLKTSIENSSKFSDLLNFNFKFKDINSDFTMLKEYNDISIQTDKFGNMTELSEFIDSIIGINSGVKNDVDIFNKRFFVYAYACVDQENWNSKEDFNNIENEFIKYTNVLSNNSTLNFNPEDYKNNYQEIQEFAYSRFGFTKQSASLLTSSIDINNYTKILFDYEHEYLYTLLIRLYQRVYLKKIESELKSKGKIETKLKEFYKFLKEIWFVEITNSLTGTMYYKKWEEIFELKSLYKQIQAQNEVYYRELNLDNDTKTNKIVSIALIISLILNLINFIIIVKMI